MEIVLCIFFLVDYFVLFLAADTELYHQKLRTKLQKESERRGRDSKAAINGTKRLGERQKEDN